MIGPHPDPSPTFVDFLLIIVGCVLACASGAVLAVLCFLPYILLKY